MNPVSYLSRLFLSFAMGLFFVASVQAGEEGSVKAISPWEGHGLVFKVEQNRAFMVGAWGGIMIVEDGSGVLDATTIICPGTILANLRTGTRTGEGRCIITDQKGDKVFANWNCSGKETECRGPFHLSGGTGKFKGISGKSQFRARILVRGALDFGSEDAAEQISAGLAMWPKLNYKIP